jgi:hypothetical protein
MDAAARSHRRIISLTILLALVLLLGSWIAFELNWVYQRRALVAEDAPLQSVMERAALAHLVVHPDDATTDAQPPLGSTIGQQLLVLFGDADVKYLRVWYLVDDDELAQNKSGLHAGIPIADLPKVRRARSLFPEAEVTAVFIRRDTVEFLDKLPTPPTTRAPSKK